MAAYFNPVWTPRLNRVMRGSRQHPPKPHIFFHNGKWCARTEQAFARATTPVYAYRAWVRRREWNRVRANIEAKKRSQNNARSLRP